MRQYLWLFLLVLLGLRIVIHIKSSQDYPEGTVIRIRDKIAAEPLRLENSQYLRIQGYKMYLPKYPEINYGDSLVAEGVVQEKSLKNPRVVNLQKSTLVLIKLREKLISFFRSGLPYRHASLVSGVVLGSRQDIDTDFWENLKKSGTVHVVVASGMNVSIVAKFLISFFALLLPRRKAIPIALIGIWLYSVLSGFDAPIIRASIMGSLVFTAQELGKFYYAGRALLLTAVIMIFIKPEWVADLGFILSFVATTSILLMDEPVRKIFKKVPSLLRSDLSASLSAQIGVAPILYASFGQFNIFSPLYNIAILWTIPIITLIGMISGMLSLIYIPLARLILYLAYPFTSWFIFCTTKI